jgi:predicted DNA-binding transcriptional regulator YafY
VFRASRIVGAVAAVGEAGAVTPPADLDARTLIGNFASDRPGSVTLAVAPGRGAGLRRMGQPAPRPMADEAVEADWDVLEVGYQELPWLVSQLCALAGSVQVLRPEEIRAEVSTALSAVLAALDTRAERPGRVRPGLDVRGASSQAQFARMLALVPWLARNDGVTVAQAAEHFGITAEQLLADLGSLITSGVDDWTLFDIQYWEPGGRIRMIDPLGLDEPLGLAPDELLAVTVACEALSALPGQHDDPVVGRVLSKLRAAAPHLAQSQWFLPLFALEQPAPATHCWLPNSHLPQAPRC